MRVDPKNKVSAIQDSDIQAIGVEAKVFQYSRQGKKQVSGIEDSMTSMAAGIVEPSASCARGTQSPHFIVESTV